jgi:DNA primase
VASSIPKALLEIHGRGVAISNPDKIYFPEAGITKLEVAQYFLAVADGALRGAGSRPNVLVRYVDGISGAADVLVDAMRGRSTTWTRIRINLEHVPEAERPAQEALDADYDPLTEYQ